MKEGKERGIEDAGKYMGMMDAGLDAETKLADGLANLMHWGEKAGVDWEAAIERALGYYREEAEG